MSEIILKVSQDLMGFRLDKTISELVTDISRSQIQKYIENGNVTVNGIVQIVSSFKIKNECEIAIKTQAPQETYKIEAENIPLEILFEDEFIVAINKPAGMVTHPAPGHKSGTLVNAIMFHFNSLSNVNGDLRPGIIHRLDKETSGVILIAKTNESHIKFAEMFAKEKGEAIKRFYTAFVFGKLPEKQGRIENFITRHPNNRQIYTTSETTGKKSITLYSVENMIYITSTKAISKINCELLTGRTHQIRVHMKGLGNHIIGDQIYGKAKIENIYPEVVRNFKRQALHSRKIIMKAHPITKQTLSIEAQLPQDLLDLNLIF